MAIQHAQPKEQRQPTRRLFTIEEYERMIDAGVFDEDERIELIRGEIVKMAPIGIPHMVCVARLNRLLTKQAGDEALVWPQNNSIVLTGSNSRPEPDMTLLKWRDDDYESKGPTSEDILLIVEVSDTTITYDRRTKGALYAGEGIPEYWIVNLRRRAIEVYTDPVGGNYKQVRHAKPGETLVLPAGLGEIAVIEILREPAK